MHERDERRNRDFKEQLGMSYARARGILKQQLRFRMVQQLGENVCSICPHLIEDFRDLTKEHIKPWRKTNKFDGNANNFWNLENIKWAHPRCNLSKGSTSKNNTSQYIGVNKVKYGFQSRVNADFGRVNMGCYKIESDGGLVYDLAIYLYHNGISGVNFPENRKQYEEFWNIYDKEIATDKTGMANEFKEALIIFKEKYGK